MSRYCYIIFSFVMVLFLSFCSEKVLLPEENCEITSIHPDSLLADLVTYIYRPPERVPAKDRFQDQYRKWFVESSDLFDWIHCHKSETGIYYFYMKRPARNIHGHQRGVGGKFRLSESGQISDFEETFNTYMISSEEIIKLGPKFISTLVEFDTIPSDSDLWKKIEFPNDASFYDKEIYEWSYKR